MLQKFELDNEDIRVIVEGLPTLDGELKEKVALFLIGHVVALKEAIERDELDKLALKYYRVMEEMMNETGGRL